MTEEEALAVAELLEHGWPGSFREEAIAVYVRMLIPLPAEPVVAAIEELLLTERHRPSVAEIYRAAMSRVGGAAPPIDEALSQGRAWIEYRAQLQWVNGTGYRPIEPEVHPAVVRACEALGAVADFDEISFTRVYREVSRRHDDGVLRRLAGGAPAEIEA
jgi:hypothetical protein